jgi:hypothetical protein
MRGFFIFTFVVYGVLILGSAIYIYLSNKYIKPLLMKPTPRPAEPAPPPPPKVPPAA